MSVSFDTLSFAKRLTEAGEKPAVAEAHAMALKEFVMDTIATKADIQALGRSIGDEIQDVRDEISDVRVEVRGEFAKVRSEIADVRSEITEVRTEMRDGFAKVRDEFVSVRTEMRGEFGSVRSEMRDEFVKVRSEISGLTERFATKDELRHEVGLLRKDIDAMGLKLTVRMGGMLAVAVGVVATLSKVI